VGTHDVGSPRNLLIDICRQVRRGQMPLKAYTWIHASAKLTPDDVKTLCDWTVELRQSLREN
jgi:Haem-binding domain